MENTYNNTYNIKKEYCRKLVLEHFGDKSMLSLPNNNFIFESNYRNLYSRAYIDTVEYLEKTYKEGLQLAKSLNINHYNDDIFNHIIKSDIKYENIWLDLCGNLNPQLITKLISIVQGHYSDANTKIALTVMGAREYLNRHKSFYGFRSLDKFRKEGFINLLSYYAKMNNVKLDYNKYYNYKSNNRVSMNLYLLTLNK